MLHASPEDRFNIVNSLNETIGSFLDFDNASGAAAAGAWPGMLEASYPTLTGIPLHDQVLKFGLHVFEERYQHDGGRYSLVEYWAGSAIIAKIHARETGGAVVALDKSFHESQDCLTALGRRLWLDTLAASAHNSINWMGTQCSSFTFLLRSQSGRRRSNGWLGDETQPFVRDGNGQMLVTSLLYFLSWLVGNSPILEQPACSVLPKIQPLRMVLAFTRSYKTHTWLGSFNAPSKKPLQIWHVSPVFQGLKRARPTDTKAPLTRMLIEGGRRKVYGNKKAMKESQAYPEEFAIEVAQLTKSRVG